MLFIHLVRMPSIAFCIKWLHSFFALNWSGCTIYALIIKILKKSQFFQNRVASFSRCIWDRRHVLEIRTFSSVAKKERDPVIKPSLSVMNDFLE